jgi:hypothetical protein
MRGACRLGSEILSFAGRGSRSGTRHTVGGAALVRVDSVEGDLFHVVVVKCSSGGLTREAACVRARDTLRHEGEHRALRVREVLALLWRDR